MIRVLANVRESIGRKAPPYLLLDHLLDLLFSKQSELDALAHVKQDAINL